MTIAPLPQAARPLLDFIALLRRNGFAVAPEQGLAFLSAIELLGPRSIDDIRQAGIATLAPPFERQPDYDMLFDMHFLGLAGAVSDQAIESDEQIDVQDDGAGYDAPLSDDINETGQAATASEALSRRALRPDDESDVLARFSRLLPARLPRRRGYRMRAAKRGGGFDLQRSLRDSIRTDGEVIALRRRERQQRPRAILLLIDVSGSMKTRSDAHLRFAHALLHAAPRVEVFTFGTRLTRLTRALRLKNREQALAMAADQVADWDGGTRIGDALAAFLAVPRFAGYARGALVLVLSDGLERGDPAQMIRAVGHLAARAWRIDWLTPLAAATDYRPETAALRAVLPMLDSLANGATTERLCRHVLDLSRRRAS
jgi:uncharacterized protein with von Willebrand factor type A (vWA) domain